MGLITLILNVTYQIITLIAAIPFKWINDVAETVGEIVSLFLNRQQEEEEEPTEIPNPYPEPVEVKGFHINNEQTEETDDDLS